MIRPVTSLNSFLLIDPASSERVRANAYFLSRIMYCFFKGRNLPVEYFTDVTVADFQKLKDFYPDRVIISLWSETQIDIALSLWQMFRSYRPDMNVSFIGYNPLIDRYGLPLYTDDYSIIINEGLRNQVFYSPKYGFDSADIEDCDKHIEFNTMYPHNDSPFQPFLTSVGCPMGCKFCMATKFMPKTISLEIDNILRQLQTFSNTGITNIHLFDENFLFDTKKASFILSAAYNINPKFKFIFLSTLSSLDKFNKHLQTLDRPKRSAIVGIIHLVEVGLETLDEEVGKEVGKDKPKAKLDPREVARESLFPILWLTITFLPGETINSLCKTGRFLFDYGLPIDDMTPRMETNGTYMGLGQFFAPYKGTGIDFEELKEKGIFLLKDIPSLRLLPTWVPYSFLNSRFMLRNEDKSIRPSQRPFVEVPITDSQIQVLKEAMALYGFTVPYWVEQLRSTVVYTVGKVIQIYDLTRKDGSVSYLPFVQHILAVALMARLGIIHPAELLSHE